MAYDSENHTSNAPEHSPPAWVYLAAGVPAGVDVSINNPDDPDSYWLTQADLARAGLVHLREHLDNADWHLEAAQTGADMDARELFAELVSAQNETAELIQWLYASIGRARAEQHKADEN